MSLQRNYFKHKGMSIDKKKNNIILYKKLINSIDDDKLDK